MGLQDQIGSSHFTEAYLIDGVKQGIAAGDPLQPLFQPWLAADPLDVAVHHDRAVLSLRPAQGQG